MACQHVRALGWLRPAFEGFVALRSRRKLVQLTASISQYTRKQQWMLERTSPIQLYKTIPSLFPVDISIYIICGVYACRTQGTPTISTVELLYMR